MNARLVHTLAITGTPGDELITGTGGDDVVLAGGGDDTVQGLGGNDHLAGQAGDDLLNGGSGDDTLIGGAGSDTLIGGSGDDLIFAGDPTRDVIDGGSGHDVLSFALASHAVSMGGSTDQVHGVEQVVGSDFADTITSFGEINKVSGGGGDDTLTGFQATMLGGAGNDSLNGGLAYLNGGAGKDVLTGNSCTMNGGAGADRLVGTNTFEVFQFDETARNGVDRIVNLQNYHVIDLSKIDADTTQGGDQAFTLASSFTGHAGQAVLVANGNITLLELDTNGDASADITVEIVGHHTDFSNFVL